MEQFDTILFDLLVKHDCVIIPDFGGFVSKRVSSKIDFDKGIIMPPSKHLLFNRHLTNNDGLLLSAYAERHGVSYIDAEHRLTSLIKKFQKDLIDGKEISFPRIGLLKRSSEGYYTFLQDQSHNLLSDAYGLKDLEFVAVEKTLEEENQAEEIPAIIETKKKPIKATSNNRKQFIKYAAAACLLPLMLYTFWIPFKSDFFKSGLISSSDFNPFYNKEKGAYLPSGAQYELQNELLQEKNEETNKIANEQLVFDEDLQAEKVQSEAPVTTKAKSPYSKQFIVGCFSVEQNAINFKLKITADGFSPRILSGGELHRVSMGSTYSAAEFNSLIASATEKGYSGWTLKQ